MPGLVPGIHALLYCEHAGGYEINQALATDVESAADPWVQSGQERSVRFALMDLKKDVDGRDKPGHDEAWSLPPSSPRLTASSCTRAAMGRAAALTCRSSACPAWRAPPRTSTCSPMRSCQMQGGRAA